MTNREKHRKEIERFQEMGQYGLTSFVEWMSRNLEESHDFQYCKDAKSMNVWTWARLAENWLNEECGDDKNGNHKNNE